MFTNSFALKLGLQYIKHTLNGIEIRRMWIYDMNVCSICSRAFIATLLLVSLVRQLCILRSNINEVIAPAMVQISEKLNGENLRGLSTLNSFTIRWSLSRLASLKFTTAH